MTELRIFRKRGGRSYDYHVGSPVPRDWFIQDKDGNQYKTAEEYEEANMPKPKPVAKKKAVKKAVVNKED